MIRIKTDSKYIPIKIAFGEDYELAELLNSKDERVVTLVENAVRIAVRKDLRKALVKYDVCSSVPDEVFCHTVEAAVDNIKKYYGEVYAYIKR